MNEGGLDHLEDPGGKLILQGMHMQADGVRRAGQADGVESVAHGLESYPEPPVSVSKYVLGAIPGPVDVLLEVDMEEVAEVHGLFSCQLQVKERFGVQVMGPAPPPAARLGPDGVVFLRYVLGYVPDDGLLALYPGDLAGMLSVSRGVVSHDLPPQTRGLDKRGLLGEVRTAGTGPHDEVVVGEAVAVGLEAPEYRDITPQLLEGRQELFQEGGLEVGRRHTLMASSESQEERLAQAKVVQLIDEAKQANPGLP